MKIQTEESFWVYHFTSQLPVSQMTTLCDKNCRKAFAEKKKSPGGIRSWDQGGVYGIEFN